MPTKLVIVESPAKAKTINKILGKSYVVKASMGHVRDLPAKRMGVDVENDFNPYYQIIPTRQKMVNTLRRAAAKVSHVYMATDMDREGEAIAWHLVHALDLEGRDVQRVVFNEITKPAILAAFDEPGPIDQFKVDAQEARRFLVRLVGYQISPLLWKKGLRGKSAGRVQSVAVRLIVDREREIQAFEAKEYWKITAHLLREGDDPAQVGPFTAELQKVEDKDLEVGNGEQATALVEELQGANYVVSEVSKKQKRSAAPPPFHTSSLQQRASTVLRFSASKTMRVAQQLYEGVEIGEEGAVGLITYMRTDSFRVADEAIDACREVIGEQYGQQYVPDKPNVHKSRKQAQGAHEAIRPTDVTRTPKDMERHLSTDQRKLYELIWKRFVASQMKPAVYNVTEAKIAAGRGLFVARGRELVFEGHLSVTGVDQDDKDQLLPELTDGQPLTLTELVPTQHFTKPPPRYSEASLVRALERNGVGRPSTYAPIISRIQQVGYVKLVRRQFHATEIGMLVTDLLVKHFEDILNVKFTSHMEEELDRIEEEHDDWLSILREFYGPFSKDLEAAAHEMAHVSEMLPEVDMKCEKCGEPMVMRISSRGRFLGCSGYPNCKNIKNINDQGEVIEPQEADEPCEKCGSAMVMKTGRRGPFFACSGYPDCKNTRPIDKDQEGEQTTDEKCENCGKPMAVKYGRRGKFLGCSGYPECRTTKPLTGSEPPQPTDEKCEKCDSPMAIRSGRRGRFLACSAYPKCKNTTPVPEHLQTAEPSDKKCDKCGKPMLIKDGRNGRFLACSGYPECKNTQPFATTGVACPREDCDGQLVERRGKSGVFYGCSKYPDCDYTAAGLPESGSEGPEAPEAE